MLIKALKDYNSIVSTNLNFVTKYFKVFITRVWSLSSPNEPAYTLSHPAYVYAAKFHPQGQHIIVTG